MSPLSLRATPPLARTTGSNFRRKLPSAHSAYEITACRNMLASDTYQTSTSSNPGRVDSQSAGTAKIVTRTALDTMVGQVLPSAWNIDEQLKMMPLAAKFQEVITSICTPTATTASSRREDVHEERRCELAQHGEQHHEQHADHARSSLKVSRTRSGLRAPKF